MSNINYFLSILILIIFLFQLYCKYSALITQRDKQNDSIGGTNSVMEFHLTQKRVYDFNLCLIQARFEDIIFFQSEKNMLMNSFHNLNTRRGTESDIRIYMLFYLMIVDFINLVIVYIFINGSFKFGFIKLYAQLIRFYINLNRLHLFNKSSSIFYIIKSLFEKYLSFRQYKFLNPETFLVFEFLCNFGIIIDIIYIYSLINEEGKNERKKNNKNIMKGNNEDNIKF